MLVKAAIDASLITYADRDRMEIYAVDFPDTWVVRGYNGFDINEFVGRWGGTIHPESDLDAMVAEREAQRAIDAVRRKEILDDLAQLDIKAIRPLREGETERVTQLAEQSRMLRSELAGLS